MARHVITRIRLMLNRNRHPHRDFPIRRKRSWGWRSRYHQYSDQRNRKMRSTRKAWLQLIVCKWLSVLFSVLSYLIIGVLLIFCLKKIYFRHHSTRPNSTSTGPSSVDEADILLKEKSLRNEIQILVHQRDCLVVELQQLQGAKPILEKAYAVSILIS